MQRLERPNPYDQTIKALYELEVPWRTPVLLNDVNKLLRPGIRPKDIDLALQILIGTTFSTEKALCASSNDLESPMVDLITARLAGFDPETTAIVFPGEGAKAVRRESLGVGGTVDGFRQFFLPTNRIVDNGRVVGVTVELPIDTREELASGRFRQILVVDDVVATGKTLNTLRAAVQECSPNPLAFTSCVWFAREPTDITGYESVRAVYRYWTREGYAALNSLSTWLRTDWKGFVVRGKYKEKYIRYPYGFDKQIDYIRSLTTIGDLYEQT